MNKAVKSYLIDCKGYDEDTVQDIVRDYHEDFTQIFNAKEIDQITEYTGVTIR